MDFPSYSGQHCETEVVDSDCSTIIESSFLNTTGNCVIPSSDNSIIVLSDTEDISHDNKNIELLSCDKDISSAGTSNETGQTKQFQNSSYGNINIPSLASSIAINGSIRSNTPSESEYFLLGDVDDNREDLQVSDNFANNVEKLSSPKLDPSHKNDRESPFSYKNFVQYQENPNDESLIDNDTQVALFESYKVDALKSSSEKNTSTSINLIMSNDEDCDDLETNSNHKLKYYQETCKPSSSFHVNDIIDTKAEENKENIVSELMRLEYEIREVTESLKNKKATLTTINLGALPDKGMRLKIDIDRDQRSLESLYEQLNRSKNKLGSSKENVNKTNHLIKEEIPRFGSLPSVDLQNLGRKALENHRVQQALTIDSLRHLHTSLHACPSDSDTVQDPAGLKVDLMTHQKQALAWMLWREKSKPSGGILADDMGLGKTLTMISLVLKRNEELEAETNIETDNDDDEFEYSHVNKNKYKGGTLIICPASVIGQWETEIKGKVRGGLLTYDIYHGNQRERKPRQLAKPNILITSYNIARVEFPSGPLFSVSWNRIILDEAHEIRNYKAKRSDAIFNLKGCHRWALTGTPIHNKTQDFYSLIKFLRCKPFDDLSVWKKWVEARDETGTKRLNMLTKSLMLRRTKNLLISGGLMQPLPEKSSESISVHLSKDEVTLYEEVANFSKHLLAQLLYQRAEKEQLLEQGIPVRKVVSKISEQENPFREHPGLNRLYKRVVNSQNIKTHEILVLLLRLRQICCHPTLMKSMIEKETMTQDGIEDEDGSDLDLLEKMSSMTVDDNKPDISEENNRCEAMHKNVFNPDNPIFEPDCHSSKIIAVLKLLEENLLKTDDKIVIVSQWSSMLDLVYNFVKDSCKCKLLTGKVPVDQRMSIVSKFNKSTSSLKVLLLSLTAGGTGLNLVGGNHLILTEPHWNPQLEAQACDRIYRIGQSKPVKIYKFICADTIEERIQLLQTQKLAMADGILTGAKQVQVAKLTLNDMKMLFNVQ